MTETSKDADQELVPSLHAGSQFGKFSFSSDSRYLFCCCGSIIKVFNTSNGECLHDLIAHTSTVTGIVVNPNNALQLVSCGQDGLLIYWDYLDGVKLRQHDFHMRLYGIVSISGEKKSIMMISQTLEQTEVSLLQWWRDKTNPNEFTKPKVLIKNCSKKLKLVSFGCNNDYVASAQKNQLTVYSMKKESINSFSDRDFSNRKSITCVACHPSDYCIATGLENGRILLWYNFFKKGHSTISYIHWHSLPVLCLNFSLDGSILLSGGHECVLVRWQMNNVNQKDFKPRMGAPVSQVLCSPDGNFYASGHSDNVIQLMDINLKILHVYRGLTRANLGVDTDKSPIPSGLLYDPRSRAIVTNGLPGHLQFFSLPLQKQLFNLDIVGQNYISPENLERPLAITQVTCAAVSSDGQWLATFEIWEDNFFSSDLRLKFWQYSTEAQTYVLNTTVESPHDNEINCMSFRPPLPLGQGSNIPSLVTTAADQCFKLWTLVDDTDIYRKNTRWDCDSVGFYRNLNTFCSDFACDGSSLAVGFEHLLTIWDPDNNVVRKTLSPHLPKRGDIKSLKFGNHECRYYLVMATENHFLSWNLLTLTVEWSIPVKSSVLIRDPDSDLMAFVSNSNCLNVFQPKTSELIYKHKNVSSSPILDVIFIPRARDERLTDVGWPGASQIYIYNKNDHLITLDLPRREDSVAKIKLAQNLPQQGMASIFAQKVIKLADNEEKEKKTHRKTKVSDDAFISAMFHSNEPVSMYGNQYLNQLLVKRKQSQHSDSKTSEDESEESEDSHSSESEEEKEQKSQSTISDSIEQSMTSSLQDEQFNSLLPKYAKRLEWCSNLTFK